MLTKTRCMFGAFKKFFMEPMAARAVARSFENKVKRWAQLASLALLLICVAAGVIWTWSFVSAQADTPQPAPADAAGGAVHEVRTLLTNEWGVSHPAGLSYSLARQQIVLLEKQASPEQRVGSLHNGEERLVVISPFEDLIASATLSATVDSAMNIAYDDGVNQLLLLDDQQGDLLRVGILADGSLNVAATTRQSVSHLGLTDPVGMEVDAVGRQLWILDGATSEVARVRLDGELTLLDKMGLSHLGASTLRGLAIHPLSTHLFTVDPVQGVLHEVSAEGQSVHTFALAALTLIDSRGLAFGPSTDLTDDPHHFHLFVADSNLPDAPPTALAANTSAQPSASSTDADPVFGRVLELQLDMGDVPQMLVVHANSSSDDSEETVASGATTVDSSDLELGETSNGGQIVGVRFEAVTLPANAEVRSAFIKFTADETGEAPTSLQIQGEIANMAAPFAEPNSDISRRLRTNTSVAWPDVPVWLLSGEAHYTPNLAPILQEIMTRPGWVNGNPVAFMITGSGQRTAHAYDGNPMRAPQLLIEYTIAQATPTPPSTTPGEAAPTATATPQTLRFAVIGDYGSNNTNEARVAALVDSWNPDHLLTTGDNNYPDGSANPIDESVGQFYSHYIGNYVGAYGAGSPLNRFWPTLGNHDWETLNCDESGCHGAYFDYFTLPNNERYYDLDLGLVHLFALDSEGEEPDGRKADSIQAAWLRDRLTSSSACHKLVYFHRAPYSSGKHGSSAVMQWPFADWGADAVIAAHDHHYERLEVNGLPYFVNGAGGAGLYDLESLETLPPEATSMVRYNADYGAMLVTVTNAGVTYQFYNAEGLLIDEYVTTKACVGAPSTPAPEGTPTVTPTITATVTSTVTPTVTPTVTETPTPVTGQTIRVPENVSTIQGAIDQAANGDLILVAPGEYHENIRIEAKTVTLASHFYTTNDASMIEQTVLDGGGSTVITVAASAGPESTVVGFTIQNGDDGISAAAQMYIANNHFRDNSDAIDYESGGGFCLNNLFENNSDDAIDLDNAAAVVIEGNVIRNNGDGGIEIRMQPYSGPTLEIVIRNNVISGNEEDGIQIIGYDQRTDRTFLIERNVIKDNLMAGLGLMDSATTGEDFRGASIPEQIHLINNTFVGNNHGVSGGDNLVALNNIFASSGALALKNVDGGSIASHNLFWANRIDYQDSNVDFVTTLSVDPRLDMNEQLMSDSPAVDAGAAFFAWNSAVVLDLQPADYGGAAPDLGARETQMTPRGGASGIPLGEVNLLYLPTVLK